MYNVLYSFIVLVLKEKSASIWEENQYYLRSFNMYKYSSARGRSCFSIILYNYVENCARNSKTDGTKL